MSRDAKIGIVVILIIVGLLVVIWGRGEKKNKEATAPVNEEITLPPPPMPTQPGVPTTPGTTVTPAVPTTPAMPATPGTPGAVTTTPGLPPVPTVGTTGTPEVVPPTTPTAIVPPVPTLPAEPAAPTTSEYTVKSGDSLAGIARTELGSEARWQEIAKLNNIAAPYSLKIGQKLKLPSGAAAPSTPAAPGMTPVVEPPPVVHRPAAPVVDNEPGIMERDGGPTVPIPGVVVPDAAAPVTDTAASAVAAGKYVVKSGDTLYSIARDVLKDPTKWSKLAELNNLKAPYALKIGQELVLPQ